MSNFEHSPARRSIELQMRFGPALGVDDRRHKGPSAIAADVH